MTSPLLSGLPLGTLLVHVRRIHRISDMTFRVKVEVRARFVIVHRVLVRIIFYAPYPLSLDSLGFRAISSVVASLQC